MAFQLVIVQGRSTQQAIPVGPGPATIGRQQGCTIRIGSSQVSRKHCELFEKQGFLLVKDLGSSNGTFVNGKRVEGQQVLEPGNELTVGSVKFRVQTVGAPGAAPLPARKPGDTAVAAPVDVEEVVDLGGDDDGLIELADDSTVATGPPVTQAATPRPAQAGAPKQAKAKEDEPIELSEDAVAGFLLDIELDDEDKL